MFSALQWTLLSDIFEPKEHVWTKEVQIIDVLDRSNISHALFHTVVEKNVFK